MKQLQHLIQKLKPKQVQELLAELSRSRGRSKKRYQLFCLLKNDIMLSENDVIGKLYGQNETAKQNLRKLILRLKKDIVTYITKKSMVNKSISQFQHNVFDTKPTLQRVAQISSGLKETSNDLIHVHTQSNQLFLNQVLLERAKCESFYLTACPLEALEKINSIHERSRFVSEAEIFHLSCKRNYLIDQLVNEPLIQTQQKIHSYYMKSNEPLIGFHFHMGSILIAVIKNESDICNFHIEQLNYLLSKNETLKAAEYHDEFILLNFLFKTSKLGSSSEIRNLLKKEFYSSFRGGKEALFKRVQSSPFELDILIRFLFILEEYDVSISFINVLLDSGQLKKSEVLTRRFQEYNLAANSISGNYKNTTNILDKLQSSRKTVDAFKFYLPIYKFLVHIELSATNFLENLDSFRRYLRRNISKMKLGTLSLLEEDLLTKLYQMLSDQICDKKRKFSPEKDLLNFLKMNYNVMDVKQIHILVIIKWFEKIPNSHSNYSYRLSPIATSNQLRF